MIESIYDRYCETDEDFWKVLKAWCVPTGWMRDRCGFRFKYTRPVMNTSGRDDIARANFLLNKFVTACALSCAWFRVDVLDLTVDQVKQFLLIARIGLMGDDGLAILPLIVGVEDFLERVQKAVIAFGLVAGRDKMGVTHNIFDAVFLAQRPYPVSGTSLWAFGPTIGRRLFKHHVYHGDGDPYAWSNGVAQMECLCYKQVPILYEQATRVSKISSRLLNDRSKHSGKPATRTSPFSDCFSRISGGPLQLGATQEGVTRLVVVLVGVATYAGGRPLPRAAVHLYSPDTPLSDITAAGGTQVLLLILE